MPTMRDAAALRAGSVVNGAIVLGIVRLDLAPAFPVPAVMRHCGFRARPRDAVHLPTGFGPSAESAMAGPSAIPEPV